MTDSSYNLDFVAIEKLPLNDQDEKEKDLDEKEIDDDESKKNVITDQHQMMKFQPNLSVGNEYNQVYNTTETEQSKKTTTTSNDCNCCSTGNTTCWFWGAPGGDDCDCCDCSCGDCDCGDCNCGDCGGCDCSGC